VIDEGLTDPAFLRERASNFEALKAGVAAGYSPEADGANLRRAGRHHSRGGARLRHRAKASMILWGMGVSQHVHGTDNARCLIALSAITGQIGKPGSGLHPLRGQNNVQGASDAGPDPDDVPQLPARGQPAGACLVRAVLGPAAQRPAGLTVVEIMHKAAAPDNDPAQGARHATSWARTRR
jgi:formate dehydrogenase major subunit